MKLGSLKKVVKNHGVLLLAPFIVAIGTINPAVYLALVNDFGKEENKTVFGITSLFAIPLMPVFIYSLSYADGCEWMLLISTLIPVILGIIQYLGILIKSPINRSDQELQLYYFY